jgi:hypothetical protein
LDRKSSVALVAAALLALPFAAIAQPPNAPFAGAARMTCAQALKQAPKDEPHLAPMAKAFDAEAARLKKSPKDPKVKRAYADAGARYAHEIMQGREKLTPPIQYRAALALCRMVLAVDPKNAECQRDESQILDVYKSMGRPIPQ